MLCGSPDGRGVCGRMDTCVCMAGSLCCPPETIIILLIGYTLTQNKKLKNIGPQNSTKITLYSKAFSDPTGKSNVFTQPCYSISHTCVCSDAQSCLTFCNPVDYSLRGFFVHGVLQSRILEWVAIFSPGDLPNPGIDPEFLTSSALQVDSLPLSRHEVQKFTLKNNNLLSNSSSGHYTT